MSRTILLYGATGYSGRLIAQEAAAQLADQGAATGWRLVLAGRDIRPLKDWAARAGMECRGFSLDSAGPVRRGLADVDVVLNAAGPFGATAERLAKSALDVRCHYVDINGEVDTYKRLDDQGPQAVYRDLVLVCGAGHTAAASDLMLIEALESLKNRMIPQTKLGAIRIAMARIPSLSHGSAETIWRSVREQVAVVRDLGPQAGPASARLSHLPVGALERSFDFDAEPAAGRKDLRIVSAANLIDTMTARLTAARLRWRVREIESYVEVDAAARLGSVAAAVAAPLFASRWLRTLARTAFEMLPGGPTDEERDEQPHTVLLSIESAQREPLIDWRLRTPNVYTLTARLALRVAQRLALGAPPRTGWLTPGELLFDDGLRFSSPAASGPLRGCLLSPRTGQT